MIIHIKNQDNNTSSPNIKKITELCEQGLFKRYNPIPYEALKRFKFELNAIEMLGIEDAFLIAHDAIEYARKNGIRIAAGRGSTTGSMVCYCLGISDIDPIQYQLLSERFINPYFVRPITTIDICCTKCDEIKKYVLDNYRNLVISQEDGGFPQNVGCVICVTGYSHLRIIDETLKLISQNHGIDVSINFIDMADKKVFDTILKGDLKGIFILEENGKEFAEKLKPSSIEDLIDVIYFYSFKIDSQGSLAEKYIKNKDLGNIKYENTKLKGLLDKTYGCLLYQEQLMSILNNLYEYHYSRADYVLHLLLKKYADIFNILEENEANELCGLINETTLGNKAHLTSITVMAYQTAWLKIYYPEEYAIAYERIKASEERE